MTANRRPVIVVSGYTAAGKTTHGRLLADALDLPFFSASGILRRLADQRGVQRPWGERWSPEIDAARKAGDMDEIVDRYMIAAARQAPAGVLDGCFLPWTYRPDDVVKLWIESDGASRARKAVVSHLQGDGQPLSLEEAAEVVTAKDEFSKSVLRRTAAAEFRIEPQMFHIVASNGDLIPEATVEAAEAGIAAFSPLLLAAVRYAAGLSDEVPDSPRLLHLRR